MLPTDFCPFQQQFDDRYGDLNNPHVRALAWLLFAPDLLDRDAPQWRGRIATLIDNPTPETDTWLRQLDQQPEALQDFLEIGPFTRLGRYAEKLMAFYLDHRGILAAHGLQVRAEKNNTIGEFDFLLRLDGQFVHCEFATKFYLLESSGEGSDADYFVGPNLADTLGAKMRKIFDRQLMLSQHPAAQALLPEPVTLAQALVKGWLFYPADAMDTRMAGTSVAHCRGFWLPMMQIDRLAPERFAILSRLDWLAPAKLPLNQTMNLAELTQKLENYFVDDTMPVLISVLVQKGDVALEIDRGFIVPNDWQTRAGIGTRTRATLPAIS